MERNKRVGESFNYTFRVCLFGWEIGWMENFGKKIGRKTFLECVWLGGDEGKFMVEPKCFLLRPTKIFPPQNGKKTEGGYIFS